MIVELTDEAIVKLQEKTDSNSNKNIRIGVTGVVVVDTRMNLIFTRTPEEDDYELNYGKFSLWINQPSIAYLDGMTLDYQYQGINEGFTFINPNAKAYCGCGESFTI